MTDGEDYDDGLSDDEPRSPPDHFVTGSVRSIVAMIVVLMSIWAYFA